MMKQCAQQNVQIQYENKNEFEQTKVFIFYSKKLSNDELDVIIKNPNCIKCSFESFLKNRILCLNMHKNNRKFEVRISRVILYNVGPILCVNQMCVDSTL